MFQPTANATSLKSWSKRILSLCAAIVLTLGATGVAGADSVVYTMSNDPAGNAILAFNRDAHGKLTPLPGSPFPTGGLGVTPTFALGPFDSDQEILLNSDKTLLFAVNGGSDSISVFRIGENGALATVTGSPFPSGGSQPGSLGLSGDTLVVVNMDENPMHPGDFLPNYTSFQVSPHGALKPIKNSTIYSELGSSPSQALLSPNGNLVFGADFLGGVLRTFTITGGGKLNAAAILPLPPGEFADTGAPPLPLGLAVHPRKPLLYVGFVTINRIGVYRYKASGALQFLRSVPDSGKAVCWLRVNKAGTRIYASNTGDPSISVYDSSFDPTDPIEIQKVFLNLTSTGPAGGFQLEIDPSGDFVYVITQQSSPTSTVLANAIHVFQVGNDGRLSEVASSPTSLPVPNLVRPQGIAIR
jgi:6-phosphogluconolactonase (cycloisomerase 2 family)